MPGPGTWSAGDILTAADLNTIGTWTTYTPTVVQSNTVTATVNYASYMKINKFVVANVDLTCTTSGTASNLITVSLPVTAKDPTSGLVFETCFGNGFILDASATDVILLSCFHQSSTTIRFVSEATTTISSSGFGASPAFTLANNDIISFSIMYEAA